MTGSELRHLLADTAASVLPGDWTTYPGPPEVVAFPAAVVVPGSPYLAPATYCEGQYAVGLSLLLPRSQGTEAFDTLDLWTEPVRRAVQDLDGVMWQGTDMGPMIAPGGVEAYGSTINLQVIGR